MKKPAGVHRLRAAAATAAFFMLAGAPAAAALSSSERTVLQAYLDALAGGRFATAYLLLSADERRYFGSAVHLASIYRADRLTIGAYQIVGSERTAKGTVALVAEHVRFLDHARDRMGSAVAKVPYGIVRGPRGPEIRDVGHPWRADAPDALVAEHGGVRVIVRKISFFTGRVEIVLSFVNRSPDAVTFLPYGRSVLRDERGTAFRPIATNLSALTDRALYLGLRLPSSGQYTGFLTFATPDRLEARRLALTLAPALADGADAPFALDFPPYALPGS